MEDGKTVVCVCVCVCVTFIVGPERRNLELER